MAGELGPLPTEGSSSTPFFNYEAATLFTGHFWIYPRTGQKGRTVLVFFLVVLKKLIRSNPKKV